MPARSSFSETSIRRGCTIRHEAPVRLTNMEIRGNLRVGAFTYFRGGYIRKLRSIGRFCAVAPGVRIGDGQHPLDWLSIHPFQYKGWGGLPGDCPEYDDFQSTVAPNSEPAAPEIGHDVWIGTNVIILAGVTIGDGAVIAAGAIVTRDVAPYQVVAGIPARPLKFRFDPETIARLQAIRWWDYTLDSMSGVPFDEIHRALDELERRKSSGLLVPRPEEWHIHRAP